MQDPGNIPSSSRLPDEATPLLGSELESRQQQEPTVRRKKPFYRARPLWLVPFAITASVVRGMTLAPRVEVYTQLSCNQVYGHHRAPQNKTMPAAVIGLSQSNTPVYHSWNNLLEASYAAEIPVSFVSPDIYTIRAESGVDGDDDNGDDDDTEDPRAIPSTRCVENPDVQAGAARLQMMMSTIMGLLSALTTGWWGHFGERHGRTKILAISALGAFLTDLVFILVSTPSCFLSRHGHRLLLLAPFIEGLLGGWSTLQGATSAYVSDCTSSGSRAHIFSRFSGVIFLGIFIGPSISGYLIQHSAPAVGGTKNVTSVFWFSIACSFINFLLALFIFPESLSEEKRRKAIMEYHAMQGKCAGGNGKSKATGRPEDGDNTPSGVATDVDTVKRQGFLRRLFSPLAIFLPVRVRNPTDLNKYRRDWSLTLLAMGYFCLMLTVGLYSLKYLYAEHVYGWGAEELSWYISYLGGMRALALLVLLPYLIGVFKPKNQDSAPGGKGKKSAPAVVGGTSNPGATETVGAKEGRPKPTWSQVGREIAWDLKLTRYSILMDVISDLVIIASPAPAFRHTSVAQAIGRSQRKHVQGFAGTPGFEHSQALFVMASGLASLGTGAGPALHSLALCLVQAREIAQRNETPLMGTEGNVQDSGKPVSEGNVGGLFGALAFMQSIGSMILGPLMFGLVYSSTVASVPKAIFMVAAGVLFVSFILMMLIRNPVREVDDHERMGRSRGKVDLKNGKASSTKRKGSVVVERGRSRANKDLRGGAAGFEPTCRGTSYGSTNRHSSSV